MSKFMSNFVGKELSNAKNLDCDKERIDSVLGIGPVRGELRKIVDARVWMSRSGDGSSPVYASVWIYHDSTRTYLSGHGVARGCGYCKKSAAIDLAFRSAGISYEEVKRFEGMGMEAVREAVDKVMDLLAVDPVWRFIDEV